MSREYVLQPFRPPAALAIDYRGELNEQQYAAVAAPPGPALVLAGAGAGKTRTLTYRVAWLLEHGVAPEKILLLTFTNKAAREMMQRVTDLIGGDLSALWGGTFHSVGNRILRRHADRLGYRPDFGIADREDARDLLTACLTDAGIDVKATRFPKAEVLADVFSMAANTGRTVADVVARDYASFGPLTGEILEVFRRYAERKRQAGLMDFDDLLGLWLKLLRGQADLGEFYQRRFQWVLVDEYQDTNTLQGELIDALVGRHRNLMAVGDDAQSIYSWRGANFANILDFPRRYAGAQVYRIETNYRSTPEILAVANRAIAANTRQFPKELRAVRSAGPKPALVVCGDAREQAAFVAQRVLELRDEGGSLNDMCVLYRSHFHAVELQMELTRRNIPFLITSGIRFFEQAHVKDVAAYLKLVTNPYDELAFKRLVRMLPGIGGRGADKLWQAFLARLPAAVAEAPPATPPGSGFSDNDGGPPELPPPPVIPVAGRLTAIAGSVPRKSAAAWAQFSATLSQCEAPAVRHSPGRLIRLVLEADYQDYLEANYENARSRLEDLEQLAAYADPFRETAEFLGQLALQSNLEAETSAPAGEEDERLRLSSIHQAKGLEFGTVFVIMLCEGLFPSNRSLENPEAGEEERRLFYVAVTRAKSELYLTRPLLRFMAGGADALQPPSRFLGEIPADLLEEWHLQGGFAGEGGGYGGGVGGGDGDAGGEEPF